MSNTTTEPSLTLDVNTQIKDVPNLVRGYPSLTIDCGVMAMEGEQLSEMMKAARAEGVTRFALRNVCGQPLIGTGIRDARIDVHGLMGNHSAAFTDQTVINTYATTFPNGVWCPGDAQVAIGNTSNPKEMNIAGSVDDLFAAYSPSGMFRIAGQGGNRCGLRGGAGVPQVWREIDYDCIAGLSTGERIESLLYKYQQRRARLQSLGWEKFLDTYRETMTHRQPPVIVFGRRVRDYFLEYAQGTIGVILNVLDIPKPAGYYLCSGMTAGHAYVRGDIGVEQLGERVAFATLEQADHDFLAATVAQFHDTFIDRMDDEYRTKLDDLREGYETAPDEMTHQFVKIVPA